MRDGLYMKDIIIRGSGGHAQETAFLLERINAVKPTWNILGYIDIKDIGEIKYGYCVLGDDSWFKKDRTKRICCAIAIADPSSRNKVYQQLKIFDLEFPNLIDPNARVAKDIQVGIGNIMTGPCLWSVNTKIDNFCLFNGISSVGHHSVIQNFVTIMPFSLVGGFGFIGEQSFIGSGAKIAQNIRIGKRAIIGASSLVLRNVSEDTTVWGIPAKAVIPA